ncbi:MAG: transcriptional regulator [Kofleriaceae bacterium]|nr:transcriptional regulator [Kofleriaceae bacterium]
MQDVGIEAAWQAGRAAWPDVVLARDVFAARLAPLDDRASGFGADLYLAAACLAGDPRAIERFDREVLGAARAAIAGIDSNAGFIDEALQRLRASLFVGDDPRLAHYAGRGPLRAWLGIAGARTALMMRRSQQRAREVPVESEDWSSALVAISTADPELELLKRQYASAFGQAFRDAIAGLEPRLRTVLRMSFVEGLSIDEIGAAYAVHRATAARWIQRACDSLYETTRTLLAERLALTPTELDRMTSLVRSQLDVSMSQLLPEAI